MNDNLQKIHLDKQKVDGIKTPQDAYEIILSALTDRVKKKIKQKIRKRENRFAISSHVSTFSYFVIGLLHNDNIHLHKSYNSNRCLYFRLSTPAAPLYSYK